MTSLSYPSFSVPFTLPSSHRPNLRPPRAAAATTTAANPQISLKVSTFSSLYDILGIPICASTHEIKAAYRKLARVCHPDVKNDSAAEFMRIHAAYATLSDPEKRRDYDRMILRRRPLTVEGLGGYKGRNWETDQCW